MSMFHLIRISLYHISSQLPLKKKFFFSNLFLLSLIVQLALCLFPH